MINSKVLYDYFDGEKAPVWYIIDTRSRDFDWEEEKLFIPIQAPFEQFDPDFFHLNTTNVTVEINELLINEFKPNQFGVFVGLIKNRIESHGYDPDDVNYLVVQMGDLEEMLSLNPDRQHIKWEF